MEITIKIHSTLRYGCSFADVMLWLKVAGIARVLSAVAGLLDGNGAQKSKPTQVGCFLIGH